MALSQNHIYAGGGIFRSNGGWNNFTETPAGGDARIILPVPNSSSILVGSDQGLFESPDFGSLWYPLDGNLANSLITSVAVNNNGSSVLTAVQDYGPIGTFDGGIIWQNLYDAGGEDGEAAINPGNSSYAYLFTNVGLSYSSDGGRIFQPANGLGANQWSFDGTINKIAFSPQNYNTMYIATANGVYKSMDWGMNWNSTGWPITSPDSIAVDPRNGQEIIVGNETAIYVTKDGGAYWSQHNIPNTVDVAISPLNDSIWFIGFSTPPAYGGGILKSTDGGKTFESFNAGLPNITNLLLLGQPFVTQMAFSANGSDLALATSGGAYMSAQTSNSWENITGNAIPMYFTGITSNSNGFYASTYGEGVLKLVNYPSKIPHNATNGSASINVTKSSKPPGLLVAIEHVSADIVNFLTSIGNAIASLFSKI